MEELQSSGNGIIKNNLPNLEVEVIHSRVFFRELSRFITISSAFPDMNMSKNAADNVLTIAE